MKSTRRSLRNHHGKPSEHAPGDPLGVYLKPLNKWSDGIIYTARYPQGRGSSYAQVYLPSSSHYPPHDMIEFTVEDTLFPPRRPDGKLVNPRDAHLKYHGYARIHENGEVVYEHGFIGNTRDDVYAKMKEWYSSIGSVSEVYSMRGRGGEESVLVSRTAERNPDWSAMRAKASHYSERAVAGARSAYDWTAPRARAAYDWTAPRARAAGHAAWEGTKAAGRAVKRGAKRAAPVIARGAKSAAERMDRWAAEPNGGVRGAKRLGSYILRYSPTLGSPESTVGMAFYQGRSIAPSIAQEALRDLKWQLDFDTHWAGRPWRRGEKKHLRSTIKSLEAAIRRAG